MILFEGSYLSQYKTFAVNEFMSEILNDKEYQSLKNMALNEFKELNKELLTLNNVPDYGEGTSISNTYKCIIDDYFEKVEYTVFENDSLNVLLEITKEDLKGRQFKHKNQTHKVKNVILSTSKYKKEILIIDENDLKLNLENIEWDI